MNPEDAELRLLAKGIKRIRRFPPGARCEVCGTTDHLACTRDGAFRCYAHIRGKEAATEADHLAGRVNFGSLTVRLDANAHRRITEIRSMLGMDTWPPAAGDPLVALAHLLLGAGSLFILLGEWLMVVAIALRERFGAWFLDGFPVSPIA